MPIMDHREAIRHGYSEMVSDPPCRVKLDGFIHDALGCEPCVSFIIGVEKSIVFSTIFGN